METKMGFLEPILLIPRTYFVYGAVNLMIIKNSSSAVIGETNALYLFN